MRDGFVRVAAASPELKVADVAFNTAEIKKAIDNAVSRSVSLLALPELCVTAYTCGDLFLQGALLDKAEAAVLEIAAHTKGKSLAVVAGFPARLGGKLYNAAAVMANGEILGVVPKSFIPNYSEFYEARHFSPAPCDSGAITLGEREYPFGTQLIFRCGNMPLFTFAVEICEDLFVADSPSCLHSLAGAHIIVNPSASDELVCKPRFRRELIKTQSVKNICGYVYADAGAGESTTDLVFSAHDLIAENGALLSESAPFGDGYCETEIDLLRLEAERLRTSCVRSEYPEGYLTIDFPLEMKELTLTRKFDRHPFIPSDNTERAERCEDILSIQSAGLERRLRHINCKSAVLGISGGLDSTLALLVTVRSFDNLGLSRTGIKCLSMPCFGTTERTKSNAQILCERLGVDFKVVDITEAVNLHLRDLAHDGVTTDAAYENAQARERTQLLMDTANMCGGLVVGTGDLSELALGWCTYNGDHMSMYGVNCSIPKTLVRHLVRHFSETCGDEKLSLALLDILDTPVSPELLPAKDGEITQKTEDIVGPYELHDFFLYYALRFGFAPKKILRIASLAFEGEYDGATIKKWLETFYRRFFNNQFKRSCAPDGPKVGTVALSPRGDWRMPSDACSKLWLDELKD